MMASFLRMIHKHSLFIKIYLSVRLYIIQKIYIKPYFIQVNIGHI